MQHARTVKQFAERIVRREIPACSYVRMACQRQLNDLEESRLPGAAYYFDEDDIQAKLDFLQCLPHTKGKWAAQRRLITLEPWQVFGLGCTYGWKRTKDNLRRFRESYWEVPRKNGKSIIAAGVGLIGFVDPTEFGSEVYSGATTEKQAWEVFRPARVMVQRTPFLRDSFGIVVAAKKLVIPADESRFEPLIGNPGDGSSPSTALIDEYHEHDTAALYETMHTGMGAREQPLIFVITTAGSNIAGPCYEKRREVITILTAATSGRNRELVDDTVFGWVWTLDAGDDWTSPFNLQKANPNFGVSVFEDYLHAAQTAAINNPAKQAAFKTKHLNIWVSARDPFFNLEKWNSLETTLEASDFAGEEIIVGGDLAAKTDLNAVIPVRRRTIEGKVHYYLFGARFFVPHDTVYQNEDNKRLAETYQKFVDSGWLTLTDGAEMDYRAILDAILLINQAGSVLHVGLDPHGATCLLHSLDDEGLNPVVVKQNFTDMSDPMKELEAAIKAGRVHHDGNPILTWCISNVTAKYMQGNDDIMRPTKESADKKIDGAVALINALAVALTADPPYESYYEQRATARGHENS